MDIRAYLGQHPLIADGSMGTYYDTLHPQNGEIVEKANLTHPQAVKAIHLAYLNSGARLLRTNTFAVNSAFFKTEGERKEHIQQGWTIAREAVEVFHQTNDAPVFIAGDMGPIPTFDEGQERDVTAEYYQQIDWFLELGTKVFVFETLAELEPVAAAAAYIKEKEPEAFVIAQFSFNVNGHTKAGLGLNHMQQAMASLSQIDAYGFNCGLGATHMYQFLKNLQFVPGKYITALPNAGYPHELRGKTIYSEHTDYYVKMMTRIAELGIDILGGCCGTTPDHIQGLSTYVETMTLKEKATGFIYRNLQDQQAVYPPLKEKLERGEKVFVVELDPPFDINADKLIDGARQLKGLGIDDITIADSPLGRSRADAMQMAVKIAYETGMPVMPHVCCRDKNRIALRAQLLASHIHNIRQLLVITGDPIGRDDRDSIKSVFDFNSIKLMQYIKLMNQEVFKDAPMIYGGALNYNTGKLDNIIKRMELKIQAGASYFLTQPIYSKEDIRRIKYIKDHVDCRILCGIMPLVSHKNAVFIQNEMPGISVPEEIVSRYQPGLSREAYEDIAVEISVDLIHKLYDIGDGYYFMTPFNRVGLIQRIIKQVKEEQQ